MVSLRSVSSRIPVVVRALVLGFVVQIVGVVPFVVLAQVNLRALPAVPWAALVEVGILWVIWRYLRGAGPPASTAETRRRWQRAHPVDRRLLPATAVTGLLYGATVASLVVLTNLWQPMPVEAVAAIVDLARAPATTAIPTLAMIAISAGVVEESAFRGVMQTPIEERHGPAVAIVLVALVFALSHAPPSPVLPVFAVGACGWGLLARLSGSILPGIVVHALVDAGFLSWVWLRPEGLERFLEAANGPAGTSLLPTACAVTLALAVATSACFVWLHRTCRSVAESPA